jgi:hypothetical protein
MRAFMSTGVGRHGAVLTFNGQGQSSTSAEALSVVEATAVLAVAEPSGCGSHQSLTWLGDWSPDVAALLAAFVAD